MKPKARLGDIDIEQMLSVAGWAIIGHTWFFYISSLLPNNTMKGPVRGRQRYAGFEAETLGYNHMGTGLVFRNTKLDRNGSRTESLGQILPGRALVPAFDAVADDAIRLYHTKRSRDYQSMRAEYGIPVLVGFKAKVEKLSSQPALGHQERHPTVAAGDVHMTDRDDNEDGIRAKG
ncbi:uncharacterized protein BDR25DRAFT_312489 [Lindgomyces ingoldianus]|uniref:Uncharacterized protein n=1 Tax=Lindgomyces ingoldianus TaxID=673940 RepID=A0ACB6R550_9PLEO|nr:uncharacterized protein BDR25DRAFT_312489 [Lindgomyces ingoldianus]KAF2473422.1 hypothetical protein BDR25DRAFT_312489 [Lindgomyces ingoldianus]